MYVNYLEGYLITGYNLVLTSDPGPGVAIPPKYYWPSNGDGLRAGGAARSGGGSNLSPAAQQALIATLTVAAVAALSLLTLFLASLYLRRRRARQEALSGEAAVGEEGLLEKISSVLDPLGSPSHGCGSDGSRGLPGTGGGGASGSCGASGSATASGSGRLRDAQKGEPSSPVPGSIKSGGVREEGAANGGDFSDRWRQLLVAINSRVTDINSKRLMAGLGGGQGSFSGSGTDQSLPPPLPQQLAPLKTGDQLPVQPLQCAGQQQHALPELPLLDGAAAAAVAAGAANAATVSSDSGEGVVDRRPSGSSAARSAPHPGAGARGGGGAPPPRHGQPQQLQLLEALGSGSFGTVFRARWCGAEVAAKLVQLPATLLGGQHGGEAAQAAAFASARERMAIQEAAISTTMTHPNIVALYCIGLRPVYAGSGGGGGTVTESDGSGGQRGAVGVEEEDIACDEEDGGNAGVKSEALKSREDLGLVVAWELQLSESWVTAGDGGVHGYGGCVGLLSGQFDPEGILGWIPFLERRPGGAALRWAMHGVSMCVDSSSGSEREGPAM